MYLIVVNTFRIVMTNARKNLTTILHDSTHMLNISFHITQAILFCHLIVANCIAYMAPHLMSQVINLLIYLDAIVSKHHSQNREGLRPFSIMSNNKYQMSKFEMKSGNAGIRSQLMNILLLSKNQINSYLVVLKSIVVFYQK